MVNIILFSKTVCKAIEIVHGAENIICYNMFRNKYINTVQNRSFQPFSVTFKTFNQSFHDYTADFFLNAQFGFKLFADVFGNIYHAIIHHTDFFPVNHHINGNNTTLGNFHCFFPCQCFSFFCNYFTRKRINYRACKLATGNSGIKSLFFIKFETADCRNLITAPVIKQTVKKAFS